MTGRNPLLLLTLSLLAASAWSAPPNSPQPTTKLRRSTSAKPAPAVPEESDSAPAPLTNYFATRPTTFLVDPLHLLSPADFHKCENLFSRHAADSKLDLYVYIIGADQVLPGGFESGEWVNTAFANGRPAAVAVYFVGEAQRSLLFFSPSVKEKLPANIQQSALQGSIVKASTRVAIAEQLNAFCEQMSINLYWMEQILFGKEIVKTAILQPRPLPKPESTRNKNHKLLHGKLQEIPAPWIIYSAATTVVLAVVFCIRRLLERRRRYHFPPLLVEPRLGAARGAGIGAVVNFSRASQRPLPPK